MANKDEDVLKFASRLEGVPAIFHDGDANAGKWETAGNSKKSSYVERKARRDLREKENQIARIAGAQIGLADINPTSVLMESKNLNKNSKKNSSKKKSSGFGEIVDIADVERKRKKTSAKKKKVVPHLSNEEDLTQAITDILQNDPRGYTDVSALGVQLQKYTGQSWNIKFKPKYGRLDDFIEKRREFHLDGTQVYLRQKWLAVKAEKEQKTLKKQQKKARREGKQIEPDTPPAKGQVNGDKKKTVQAGTRRVKKRDEGNGCCYKFFLFLIFVSFIVLTLLYLYTNGYLKPYLKPYQPQIDYGIKELNKQWSVLSKWSSKQFQVLSKKAQQFAKQAFTFIYSQLKKHNIID